MKVEVAVLGSPSLIVRRDCVDVKQRLVVLLFLLVLCFCFLCFCFVVVVVVVPLFLFILLGFCCCVLILFLFCFVCFLLAFCLFLYWVRGRGDAGLMVYYCLLHPLFKSTRRHELDFTVIHSRNSSVSWKTKMKTRTSKDD